MNRPSAKKHCSAVPLDRLKHRWETWLFAAILIFVWTPRSYGLDRVDFYFATIENTATGMHAKESRLALLTIMQKIFSPKYPEMRLHLDFLARDAGLADTIVTKQYDVIATTGLDYLELMKQVHLRPLAILSKTDQPVGAFMLITDKNKTLDALKKIPERTLIIEAGGGGDIAKLWIDTLLQARGLPKHNLFFDILRTGDKPSRTLLPVFFGQADACVVSEDAFEVMNELNPQLKERLAVRLRSPGFINLLISATDRLEDWARDIVIEETARMNTSPDGQQILTTIQMKRFFPFKPEYLEATERIYQSQRRSGGGS
jgi:ABC-type phosphate/phosphonate transport system substrate-binding protein